MLFFHFLSGDLLKVCNEQKRINRYLQQKRWNELNQKYQEKLKQKCQSEYRDNLAKKLFQSLPDITIPEEKCYQNAVKHYAAKWDEQENKRNKHVQQIKQQRLFHQSKEMEAIKQLKETIQHEHNMEKEKRAINEKIDLIFYRQQYADRLEKCRQLRNIISQQIELNKKAQRDEMITSRIETNRAIESEIQKDDQHFFHYATKLIKSAKHKGIPVHPLKKVINEYAVHNSLLPQTDDLPHMKSQIDIGISLERKYSIQ